MIDNEFAWETAIAILAMEISKYVDSDIEYQELDKKINHSQGSRSDIVVELFEEKGLDIKGKKYCHSIYASVLDVCDRINQSFTEQQSTITVEEMIKLDKEGAAHEIMRYFYIDPEKNSFWDAFDPKTFNYKEIEYPRYRVDIYGIVETSVNALCPDILERAENNHNIGKNAWLPTRISSFYNLMNSLSPIFLDEQSFLSSEPYSVCTKSDEDLYVAGLILQEETKEDRFFLKLMTIKEYRQEFHK